MHLPHLYISLSLALPTLADWQYRSRPDLNVPRLNITIPAGEGVGKGYIFAAPFSGHEDTGTRQYKPRQAGPYIFRDDGDLIWSGYGYFSIWAANFQKITWHGIDFLAAFEGDHNPNYGHGHGHITILDYYYRTLKELRAGKHKISDKHEFQVINEDTGLIQIYQPVPRDLTDYGAKSEQQWIVNAIFQELDLRSGDVLFEWASLDHVAPDEAILPINPGQAGSGYNSSDAWDYFHINSVDKDDDGNYLISARDACSVHKINGTTGDIIWRLDGLKSDFKLKEGVKFCFQHHARFLEQYDDVEIISLYDNAAHGTESDSGHAIQTSPTSSGKIIKLNTTSWTAELVQGFYPPDDLLSKSQGSTQILPNGNALVNWGSEGAVTEFLPNGTAIYHAYLDSGEWSAGVENYRAYRYNWTGYPLEEPALVALHSSEGTKVYVSWNGDTETRLWRFFEDTAGSEKHIADVKRESFETVLQILNRNLTAVFASALDGDGHVLTTTEIATAQVEVVPISRSHNNAQEVHDAGAQIIID